MEIANNPKKYNTTEHLVYSCQYHVIFCPKYRRKVLTPPYDERLKELLLLTAEKWGFSIPDMEVMPDHVHLIVDCEFPELAKRMPCMWTRSSFISSVGSVSLEVVKRYIENQKTAPTYHQKKGKDHEQD